MKRVTKIAIAVGTALSLGLAAAAVSAHPNGYGPGWGGGHMGGYMQGYGMGPGMMGGYGPGNGMGPGMMGGYGPGNGMGPGMMGGYGPGYGMHAWGNPDESLAAMKAELAITEKQEGAWQAFTNNAKKQSESRQAWFAKMHEARSAGSAPEVLAQRTELMKQRQAEMEANTAALKDLYAVLTPEQKSVADQRFGGFGPGYGAGYGRGYGGPRGYSR
ncbi:MAG: Spy/CpxP family protein refolding chaperone [Burkholderiales bacterium]|nr:Spy/CpxP family protein refolding chaperone [Burkholderiales bacterium]